MKLPVSGRLLFKPSPPTEQQLMLSLASSAVAAVPSSSADDERCCRAEKIVPAAAAAAATTVTVIESLRLRCRRCSRCSVGRPNDVLAADCAPRFPPHCLPIFLSLLPLTSQPAAAGEGEEEDKYKQSNGTKRTHGVTSNCETQTQPIRGLRFPHPHHQQHIYANTDVPESRTSLQKKREMPVFTFFSGSLSHQVLWHQLLLLLLQNKIGISGKKEEEETHKRTKRQCVCLFV